MVDAIAGFQQVTAVSCRGSEAFPLSLSPSIPSLENLSMDDMIFAFRNFVYAFIVNFPRSVYDVAGHYFFFLGSSNVRRSWMFTIAYATDLNSPCLNACH